MFFFHDWRSKMKALLLYQALAGFACVPPLDAKIVASPYSGPFVMSLAEAEQRADKSDWTLKVIREDDKRFAEIKARCAPIFF
jgi:hypothetical protein